MAETGSQFNGIENLAQWGNILAANNSQVLGKGTYLDAPYQTEVDGTMWSITPMDRQRRYQVPPTVDERVTTLLDAGVRFDMWLWAEAPDQQLMIGLIRVSPTEAMWIKLGAWVIPDTSYSMQEPFPPRRRKRQTR